MLSYKETIGRDVQSKTCQFLGKLKSDHNGQALVEFTLIFVLMLVLTWIPADFGLAIYTGQLALNASREGARIAAVEPNLPAQTGTCTLPCSSAPAGSILNETAKRLSSALLPGATITVTYPVAGGAVCNEQVNVSVQGQYNFFYYQLLRLLGGNGSAPNTANIVRATNMRWEYQTPCLIGS